MSRDHFESLACTLSPEQNFDEIYAVIDRTNGRMIERMSLRLGGRACNNGDPTLLDQIFMDSAVNFSFGSGGITAIYLSADNVYIIEMPNHGFSEGDIVHLGNVNGVPSLSHRYFIIYNVTTNTFYLGAEVFP